jgi:hypothetical protein
VISDRKTRQLALWREDAKPEVLEEDFGGFLVSDGNWLAWPRGEIVVVRNAAAGTFHNVRHPAVARWQHIGGSFSPDGCYLAISGETEMREPNTRTFIETIEATYEPTPSVMTLIELTTGSVQIVDGQFDNWASDPVWSADGDWVIFAAPYERRRLFGFRPAELVLHTYQFKRITPMPMLDFAGRLPVPPRLGPSR